MDENLKILTFKIIIIIIFLIQTSNASIEHKTNSRKTIKDEIVHRLIASVKTYKFDNIIVTKISMTQVLNYTNNIKNVLPI